VIIIYFLKWNNFSRLAEITLKKSWRKGVSILSQLLIIVLILDETGLLLNEWGIKSGFLDVFRKILEIPGINRMVFLANLGLIIPAAYTLTSGLIEQTRKENDIYMSNWKDYDLFNKKYSLFVSVFVLTITLLFFLVQSLFFGEFHLSKDIGPFSLLVYLILIFSGPIIILKRVIAIEREISKTHNPFRFQPWFEKSMIFVILLICFLSFTQTMITKVLLLLTVVSWAGPGIIKLMGFIIPKVKSINISNLDSAYEKIINGLTNSSIWNKWNFIFLTSSFVPLLFLFQSHSGPFPPSGSAYPKTETISALYMLYMILFLFIGSKGKFIWLKSIIWTLVTIFILYLTPVFFPSWYFPSVDPPGFSAIEVLASLSNIWVSALFFFSVHLLISLISISLYYSSNLKNELIKTNYESVPLFRKYFLIVTSASDLFPMILFPVLLLATVTSETFKILKLNVHMGLINNNIRMTEYILILLPALLHLYTIKSKAKRINVIKEETLKIGGKYLIYILRNKFDLLNSFKSWNGTKSGFKSLLFFFVPFFVFILLLSGSIYLPGRLDNQKSKINWAIPLKNEKFPTFHLFEKVNNKILFSTSNNLNCTDPKSGVLLWSLPVEMTKAEINKSGMIYALTKDEILAIGTDTGNICWRNKLDYNEINQKRGSKILLFKGHVILKENENILLFDDSTGKRIIRPGNMVLPQTLDFGGSIFWLSRNNLLRKFNPDLTIMNVKQLQDTVIQFYSYPDELIVRTKNGIWAFDDSGKYLWEKNFEKEETFKDLLVSDSLIYVSFEDRISVYNMKNYSEKWRRKGFKFENIGYSIYSPDKLSPISDSLTNGVFASDDKNIYFLDKNSGHILKVFTNALEENKYEKSVCIGYSNNLLLSMGFTAMSVFSFDAAQKLYTDFYIKSLYNEDPDYFYGHNERVRLKYKILLDDNVLYILNAYGLVALKLDSPY
jgi:outer membrane protein assembly factor BamB